jgi:hypothetical protein
MKSAGDRALALPKGVILSGVVFDEDCWRIAIWRSSLCAGAEGAKGIYRNLSGKRTDLIFQSLRFVILSSLFTAILWLAVFLFYLVKTKGGSF